MKAKLYINRQNLKENIEYIRNKIGNRKIIAMVKANAYGTGDTLVAQELQNMGVDAFGVANIEEAKRIRQAGIQGMILVTCVVYTDELKEAIANDISMSISDIEELKYIDEEAKRQSKVAKLHIKVDTGMTRLGFTPENVLAAIKEIEKYENIELEGIYTHLSCADSDEEYTLDQIRIFRETVEDAKRIADFKYIHILNSDGTEMYTDEPQIDTHVRVGISMYGYSKNMQPITKLTAPVIHINNIDKYTKVGYSGTYIAKPNTKIAVVKIGYADGLSRCLSNNISVVVNGVECAQVGNICMDMMMIDVTDAPVSIGDEVIIWDYTNDLKDIAKLSHKIVYEVISNLGDRIERIVE
jgi:alanine racemase